MSVSKFKMAVVTGLSILAMSVSAEAAKKKSGAKNKRSASRQEQSESATKNEPVTPPTQANFDLATLAELMNSYQTIGQLTADLTRVGLATTEERTAIENFLQDRGVSLETPTEKMKFDPVTNAFRWSEITLAVQPDGNLKNSYGQILKVTGKTLDTNFGEAYLSFDRRTSRARAMDIFLQEAHADSTGAIPSTRAWGALTASIYGALKAVGDTTGALLSKASSIHSNIWNKLQFDNTVKCGPKGEYVHRKSSELTTTVDAEILQTFFETKTPPKCDQGKAAQMQVIVRAKGVTAKEKIRNAQIGKGYGPEFDRNWGEELKAQKSPGIQRVKAAQ